MIFIFMQGFANGILAAALLTFFVETNKIDAKKALPWLSWIFLVLGTIAVAVGWIIG